jgi:hypothetical protein
MKRIILLAALLLAASACTTTTPTTNNTNTSPANTNANANANTTATPQAEAPVTADTITAQEKAIWDKIKNKDADGFAGMLADDFIYIAGDGIYDKAGTVEGIKQLEITDLTLTDWKVVMLDKDAAAVTYTVTMKGTSGGKPIPNSTLRASSAWVKRGDKWVGVYHQECERKEPPPTPPAKPADNKTAAKATPTPEAKPAESPSGDPIAREKQVWDAIKSKNYDAFANFLAEDQIEVEEFGVLDKAGSVKGIQEFDASKATLSDFKSVNLDSNATLVTYLVKIPIKGMNPLGERHSTIWVNRSGKWLAALHHGTGVTPPAKAPAKK